jgi:NADH-quinone oxidoreductase subunit G
MVNITINGKAISVKDGTTILQAARENGIIIPSLCYLKDINEVASCRVCVVEIKGNDRLATACNTVCMEGMDILTNSKRAIEARRNNVALILSQHDCHCPTCARNSNCSLQNLAGDMNLLDPIYEAKLPENDWDMSLPIIRTNSKCIQCLRCVNICDKIQGMQVWDLLGTGRRATVGVREGRKLGEVNCTYFGALRERDDTVRLMAAINDPDKVVVLQVAPAVRAAWGDGVGLPPEMATEKRMAAAFRALGVDYVFDTNFAADLTIMEEGNELIGRMADTSGKAKMPMFTSCCPGWVRFMKLEYPELVGHLSTAKSPQQMFGAVTKTYFAKKIGVDPKKIVCVSVMPCTAKKYESSVPELNDAGAGADVDIVLTTREIARLMRVKGINVFTLPEQEFDSPLGTGTGAAVIFGATGGVMEAALRTAYFVLEGKNPDPDAFKVVRGLNGRKEVTVTIAGIPVHACVASGLANARAVMEDIVSGRSKYDFIEIMACPGGCAGGGGQPITDGLELAGERGARLYDLDAKNKLRFSHENPSVRQIYAEFFRKPLSHKSHELLHTDQTQWTL